MNAIKTLNKFLNLFRIFDWIHVLGLPILGFTYASEVNFRLIPLLLSLLVSSLYLAHGYALNETFDTIIKYKNSYIQFIKKKGISFNKALIISCIPLVINIVIAISISKDIFFLVIYGSILSYFYSVPPTRFKKKPFIDLITNSLGFSILFLIGYCSIKSIDKQSLLITALFFILFIPLQLIHEIAHLENDIVEDTTTTVAIYGIKKAINLIFFSLLLFISWTILLYIAGMPFLIFLISCLFSVYIIVNLLKRCGEITEPDKKENLKIHVRFISIIYGLGILFILLYSKLILR